MNLGSGSINSVTRSIVSSQTNTNQAGNIPVHLGQTVYAGSCYIGLSTIKNLEALGFFTDSTYCGTHDGVKSLGASTGTGILDYAGTYKSWLFNVQLAEVAVFNHKLTDTEKSEIYNSIGVW